MQLAWKVAEGSKVKLKNYDPDFIDKHTDRALAMAELEQLGKELGELQELLAAAKRWGWAGMKRKVVQDRGIYSVSRFTHLML